MPGWIKILTLAFVLQLSVLPGEKVQFIIAGLATRFNPLVVVTAAGTAFAGWTAVEIVLGAMVQRILGPVILEAITAGLFFLFAVLLFHSTPTGDQMQTAIEHDISPEVSSDITLLGREIPPALWGFLPIFMLMAAGEFGDKTQLVTISLAFQYGAHPAIWFGEMLAIIPVSLLNAIFFHRFAAQINLRVAHFAGAFLFLFFGLDSLLQIVMGFSLWEVLVSMVVDELISLFRQQFGI